MEDGQRLNGTRGPKIITWRWEWRSKKSMQEKLLIYHRISFEYKDHCHLLSSHLMFFLLYPAIIIDSVPNSMECINYIQSLKSRKHPQPMLSVLKVKQTLSFGTLRLILHIRLDSIHIISIYKTLPLPLIPNYFPGILIWNVPNPNSFFLKSKPSNCKVKMMGKGVSSLWRTILEETKLQK